MPASRFMTGDPRRWPYLGGELGATDGGQSEVKRRIGYATIQDHTLCSSDGSCAPHERTIASRQPRYTGSRSRRFAARYLVLGSDTCSPLPALFHSATLKHNLLFFFYRPLHITARQYFFPAYPLALQAEDVSKGLENVEGSSGGHHEHISTEAKLSVGPSKRPQVENYEPQRPLAPQTCTIFRSKKQALTFSVALPSIPTTFSALSFGPESIDSDAEPDAVAGVQHVGIFFGSHSCLFLSVGARSCPAVCEVGGGEK